MVTHQQKEISVHRFPDRRRPRKPEWRVSSDSRELVQRIPSFPALIELLQPERPQSIAWLVGWLTWLSFLIVYSSLIELGDLVELVVFVDCLEFFAWLALASLAGRSFVRFIVAACSFGKEDCTLIIVLGVLLLTKCPSAYHSSFNKHSEDAACTKIGGIPLLPIHAKHSKGPAPRCSPDEKQDIIDHAIRFFRANVLFASYPIEAPADRLMIYLTLFCHQCVMRLAKCNGKHSQVQSKDDASRLMYQLGIENFPLPTDTGFMLRGFFEKVDNKSSQDQLRAYLQQCRQEMSARMAEVVLDGSGKPSKWWLCFAKRKFLGKALEGPGSR
eukprot:gene3072-5849_t